MDSSEENILWSEEKCIQLIREYKSRPVLWDTEENLFYKHEARKVEWESLGRALNISANDCKYKMNILMSSFRREKAKFKKSAKSGKPYVTSWFAFTELSFLMNRKVRGKIIQINDDDSDHSKSKTIPEPDKQPALNIYIKQRIDLPGTSNTIFDQDTSKHTVKIELESDENSDLESSNQTPIPTHEPCPENNEHENTYSVATSTEPIFTEEIVAFTNFVQYKMMKYSEKTITAVQKAICDILFKADDGYYDNDDILGGNRVLERNKSNIPTKRRRLSNLITIEKRGLHETDSSSS